jgi:hypothetical protein
MKARQGSKGPERGGFFLHHPSLPPDFYSPQNPPKNEQKRTDANGFPPTQAARRPPKFLLSSFHATVNLMVRPISWWLNQDSTIDVYEDAV